MFTCQNSSCKRTFTEALKTLNLQENPTEPFFACPFCLTKMEKYQTVKAAVLLDNSSHQEAKPIPKAKSESRESHQNKENKPSGCLHHPGYLSERAPKEQIPDECLVCKIIVDCMLKKMRN